MTNENGPRAQYDIDSSQIVLDAVKGIQAQASLAGKGEQVHEALRHVKERLVNRPFDFGEPLYRLPALRMQIRTAIVPPLVIHFGVCEDRPLVFIKGVHKMPGSGF